MLIKNKKVLKRLLFDLRKILENKKNSLFQLNKEITLDAEKWISEDYRTVMSYLKAYIKNNYSSDIVNRIKPKGKILIISSYNEPFILSIIPIINALVLGNEVTWKPSQYAEEFVEKIWKKSGLIEKYKLKLNIISLKRTDEIIKYIENVRAVYFFGSQKVALEIARVCGEKNKEFYPEIEAADVKVFNGRLADIRKDVVLTLKESFTHFGQTCQRIQGILINKENYDAYLSVLRNEFLKLQKSNLFNDPTSEKFIAQRQGAIDSLINHIEDSNPKEIIKVSGVPLIVIEPDMRSRFVKNAYFLPALWVSSFDSKEELADSLNSRDFFLGLNIQSSDPKLVEYLIENTKFTRYTVNTSHTNIRSDEGWGGSWPTGFSGYKSWLEHFSDGYTVIDDGE
jgi:aldehyde dehydrogenase (NAD+)